MRILVCASEAPIEPLNGMRLQLAELVARLALRHEVCVLAFRWPEQRGAVSEGVELVALEPPSSSPLARGVGWLRAAVGRQPLETAKLVGCMARAVERTLEDRSFDVAHVTLGSLAPVAPALGDLPAILSPLDAWHVNEQARAESATGVRRRLLAAHAGWVRRFTASAYRPYRRVVFVTEEDAAAALALDPTLGVAVIPNGIDLERYRPEPSAPAAPGQIVFTGAMSTPANARAARVLAERILPAIRARRPDARLALVGRGPGPEVTRLGALNGVTVTGEVPDVRPWLWGAQVFACPMESGTGIKNKLLEALACGTPTVVSPLSRQGLAVKDGRELVVAEGPEAFANAVLRLLDDAPQRAALAAAARRYVVEHHNWEAVARAYEALYTEASRSRQVRT